jgi:hypothetical protein
MERRRFSPVKDTQSDHHGDFKKHSKHNSTWNHHSHNSTQPYIGIQTIPITSNALGQVGEVREVCGGSQREKRLDLLQFMRV